MRYCHQHLFLCQQYILVAYFFYDCKAGRIVLVLPFCYHHLDCVQLCNGFLEGRRIFFFNIISVAYLQATVVRTSSAW
jgi:hypothetical protein